MKADSAFSAANVWNSLLAPFGYSVSEPLSFQLVDSTGAATGASLSVRADGGYNGYYNVNGFPDSYLYLAPDSGTQAFSFSGLAPDTQFTLFLYNFTGNSGGIYTIGNQTISTANGTPSSEDPAAAVTGELTGMTSDTGSINGTYTALITDESDFDEADWSGFQLDLQTPGTTPTSVTPEPGSMVLLGTGLLGLAAAARRRQAGE